ncbi:serine/threonine-protein kinase [Mucilaginibacter sp. UR6-11]|uniref:serine/threonine-protein kinase n=1 Tax=Mucilaginibacter sp. UR6-11 TaxID=1435644 RepID=UPI001E5C0873|nr:serine/threonine-protein kinase [Mucilaginibacter sp. UR6-11]MCC8426874.1 serine/threonine protein kinase [Mucilaginibacter sp. UR6-11]
MSKVFTITDGLENMGALRTGGQGSVYKGRRIGPIITAVKILPTPIHSESEEDKNYRNFLNEVDKLKKVNEVPNPNVVKILNSGITESGSFPFIEMEFIEGPDLGDLLAPPNDKIFTLKDVIKLADQLACALAHCHKVGVKHGDIKSNNIKFNIHSGNYVLLDFGLSIMSDEDRRSSMRHAGAIEFMAPEQNEGKMLTQTDVYSYGVILFELLAGVVPFPLEDNGETARNNVMLAHMEAKVPDILNLRKQNLPTGWSKKQRDQEMNVPQWLLKLTYKCLEKSPDNRFANGMELHEAIIQNSIADIKFEAPAKIDNDTIKEQAREVADPGITGGSAGSNNMIQMSKPVFTCLILLLMGFMGYTAYLLFNKPAGQTGTAIHPVSDSVNTADSIATVNKAHALYREKKRLTDSIMKATVREELEKSNKKNPYEPDSTVVDTSDTEPKN